MEKKSVSKDSGFTLVELMVVVAIIGILSAIAVPNFKKYQAKSKQSEAKIQLAAVYNTEVGANADYDTYATCISDLGYELSPKGYYIVGFTASDATALATITARQGSCTASNYAMSPTQQKKVTAAAATITQMSATTVTTTSFTASAAGNISASLYDTWKINEGKALINITVGY